jgi:DNA modification methylase
MSAIVLRGDARALPLPDESVDLICTSPPYWQLRDYRDGGESLEGQIGSEPTPQEYIATLITCTREWMRVLKPAGSMFVNLADKYSGRSHGPHRGKGTGRRSQAVRLTQTRGSMEKSLLGLPSRYMLACLDELGLIVRRDIIWAKVNGIPESVTDRCTSMHEYLFHLVKQPSYYTAADEIREPQKSLGERHEGRSGWAGAPEGVVRGFQKRSLSPLGKLPGSVWIWEIPSSPLFVPPQLAHARCCDGRPQPDCEGLGHHAAFPPELPSRCILGWSPPGICLECGEGRRPVTSVERVQLRQRDLPMRARLNGERIHGPDKRAGTHVLNRSTITGYACACPHATAPTRPALIVDPFGGTGTTALAADVLGRTAMTIDRSADYCRLATWRIHDPGERARALGVPKPPPVPRGQMDLFGGEVA